jgi:hypothetical protein
LCDAAAFRICWEGRWHDVEKQSNDMALELPRDVCGSGQAQIIGHSSFEPNHHILDHQLHRL